MWQNTSSIWVVNVPFCEHSNNLRYVVIYQVPSWVFCNPLSKRPHILITTPSSYERVPPLQVPLCCFRLIDPRPIREGEISDKVQVDRKQTQFHVLCSRMSFMFGIFMCFLSTCKNMFGFILLAKYEVFIYLFVRSSI